MEDLRACVMEAQDNDFVRLRAVRGVGRARMLCHGDCGQVQNGIGCHCDQDEFDATAAQHLILSS